MDPAQLIEQLEKNGDRIGAMVEGVSEAQARWKPDAESWSILEVINHLYDEERQDFRVRLDITLHDPARDWPPIDPQGWVSARQYNQRDLGQSIQNFVEERKASLAWLKSLRSPDWNARYEAPFGLISAGDLFAAWVAHDLLHLRQLVELHHAFVVQLSSPYQTEYAGGW